MIQIDGTSVHEVIFHRIKQSTNELMLSDETSDDVNEEESNVMKKIFLKPFQNSTITYEFMHPISIDLNPLYSIMVKMETEPREFIAQSKHIAEHLQMVSKHPNIKDGDLFIMRFSGIQLKGNAYDAVGIYKIENKESFIETPSNPKGAKNNIVFKKGISSRKLDKACLILFTEKPYTIFSIDNSSADADYWQNEFIKLLCKKDNINSTNDFLSLTKNFVTKQLPSEFEVSKADQIDLLNRSVDYFKTHETFDKAEFENEVLHHDNLKESFRKFDETQREENDLTFTDNFEIASEVVKKQARNFKSILKLDKNFHIYIHGNRELIESGVDETGRKYYKIYYEEEH